MGSVIASDALAEDPTERSRRHDWVWGSGAGREELGWVRLIIRLEGWGVKQFLEMGASPEQMGGA